MAEIRGEPIRTPATGGMIREKELATTPGFLALPGILVFLMVCVMGVIFSRHPALIAMSVIAGFLDLFCLRGLFIVNPNEGKVLQLFGNYAGTVKTPGLHFANPFYSRSSVSLRVRNFESSLLKVNDHDGNPIEIAAIVVWRVVDTAEAMFEVDNYEHYVRVQTEAAVRNLATRHPYDAHQEGQLSLRGNSVEIAGHLKAEVEGRLAKAGVEVIEARISHLAYAPEIAAAMLRRQQASAIVAARQKIVEGAVSMVEMALSQLSRDKIVDLTEETKAALVANLMVVLCSDHNAQPIINAGLPPRSTV